MQFCDARQYRFVLSAWRSARHVGLAAILAAALAPQGAEGLGETRTLTLHNIHTHDDLTITYKKNGRFDDAAIKTLNSFLRDWRKEEETRIDPQLFDILWEVHNEVGSKGPIHVVCGYRSPATNAMLRSRSSGVARTSLHMQGKAIDFSIPDVPVETVRAAALRLQEGGVGYYPTSGIPFVHVDVGNVRHWPRMTREQLARVFPNGRTVHLPADGNPMPGYELARADIERGANRHIEQPKARSLIASLFGGAQDAEETADNNAVRQNAAAVRRQAPAPAAPPAATVVAEVAKETAKPVPLPPTRPTFQIASATSTPAPAPAPAARPVTLASLSPNDIVNARGYWQGPQDGSSELAVSAARRGARTQTASADPDITAGLGRLPRNDRVPPDIALAYAAQVEASSAQALAVPTAPRSAPAVVSTQGNASVALKPAPATPASAVRTAKVGDRANDPWLRGVVMAPRLQTSLTTTLFGAPDFRTLQPFMQKPGSTVMMTFSTDPHLGMTTESFSGSAVVFQATVTFGMRTAALR